MRPLRQNQRDIIMKVLYNSRDWLNTESSSSTSSVVCFDGICDNGERRSYVEITDCYHKIKLHNVEGESKEAYISKLKCLHGRLEQYINYLQDETTD